MTDTQPPPAVRALRLAAAAAVVTGCGAAVATAIAPGSAGAGARIAVAAVLAVLWPLLVRRLEQGNPLAYARIRRSALLGAVALLVVIATGPGPGWLRALQGAQCAAQLGVFAATAHPALRRWYAAHRPDPERAGAWKPALLLAVLAPLVAEVSIGDLPFTPAGGVAAVFALPIYGAGALLVRELVRRAGRGWPSILLLGLGYAIVEEGLALQSFFDPTIYGGTGPAWGARVFGINGTYTLVQLVNHAVWSIAVPILLTELAWPRYATRPYLARFGLVGSALLYPAGVGLLLITRSGLSAGYSTPPALLVGSVLAVGVLAVVALRVLPRTSAHVRPGADPAPRPGLVFGASLGAGFAFLAVLVLPGHLAPGLMSGPGVLGPLLVSLAVVGTAVHLVRRWSTAPGWDRPHSLALAGGALIGHTLLWGVTQPATWTDRAWVGVLLVLGIVALRALARRGGPRPPDRVVNPARDRPGWQSGRQR